MFKYKRLFKQSLYLWFYNIRELHYFLSLFSYFPLFPGLSKDDGLFKKCTNACAYVILGLKFLNLKMWKLQLSEDHKVFTFKDC